MNLDPAAETFDYPVAVDIRELVSVADVMDELDFGPNGSLIFAFEYLATHLDFLANELQNYNDDYLLIDLPGQIELYSHLQPVKSIINFLQREGYSVCAVYCLDSMFVSDRPRFVAGIMMCLSAMVHLEIPHVNLLTKCDQLQDKTIIDEFCDPQVSNIYSTFIEQANETEAEQQQPRRWSRLNAAIAQLIEEYSMVSFIPLDITDEESIDLALMHIDHAIQYGEDVEPTEPRDEQDVDGLDVDGMSFS